jgi:hypothetical protein
MALDRESRYEDHGGLYLSKRCIVFSALLVLVLAAGSALAAEDALADKASPGAEASANADNVSSVKEETASPAADSQAETGSVEGAAPANLQYIWSLTGIEADQITMVLNQSENDLSGQAKYEGSNSNPWNAVVVGSVSGDKVDLVMTAMKGTEMVSTKMSGTFSADTISGKFVQTDMTGKSKKNGDFSAVWINPDTSAYTPADVTEAKVKPAATADPAVSPSNDASSAPTTTTNEDGTAGVTTSGNTVLGSGTSDNQPKSVQLGGKTQYTDIHKYAQQYETGGDLSGVPPGMGGGGL